MSMHFPQSNFDERTVQAYKSMLEKGQDPKDMLIEAVKPRCEHWAAKLHRCELKLKQLGGADPEKSCMYPLRDYVSCVDSYVFYMFIKLYLQVNPMIQNSLVGNTQKGWFS